MLSALELTNIRSYKNAVFEFSDGVNIVVGPNASGKTNLLESIYMSARGSSFKSDDQNMIFRGERWGRIDANFIDHNRSIRLQKEPFLKKLVFDEVEKKRMPSDKLLPVVLFEPAHLIMLSGEPEGRRSYFDNSISQANSRYSTILKNYKRTLQQRNRLLKQDNIASGHLFVWDLRLSELAGKIVEERKTYLEFLNTQISNNYRAVSGNKETIVLVYETKLSTDQYVSQMLNKLKTDLELDIRRGFTGTGPHRDDFIVMLDENDARYSASRGENRSIILALKISELNLYENNPESSDIKPLLLLDDVFSELDGKRRKTLSASLSKYQTFITTTDADVAMDYFSQNCNIIPTSTI